MLSFFDQIIGFFVTIWTLISNFVQMLVTFIDVVAQSILVPHNLMVYLPPIIGTAVLIVVAVSIVKLILGR